MLRAADVAAVAVSAFAGVAFAADAPEPSPTSGAAAVSSSLVAAVLCPAVKLLLGNRPPCAVCQHASRDVFCLLCLCCVFLTCALYHPTRGILLVQRFRSFL
ncbi:unnamed protein product [Miscanthus lutarioriparius]|uniref:Uncharacterized protein n=1 Tax=Miscanthus lutarioriparius TaxID=422564 RepID=A0A811RV98_9POAL|nr:unnamed protein product [Miscanthus lutarioriparius]